MFGGQSSLRHGTAPQPDGGDIADDHDTDLAEQEEQCVLCCAVLCDSHCRSVLI